MKITREQFENIKIFRNHLSGETERMERLYPSVYTGINLEYNRSIILALDYAIKKLKKKVIYPKLGEPTSADDMVKKEYVDAQYKNLK